MFQSISTFPPLLVKKKNHSADFSGSPTTWGQIGIETKSEN